LSNVWIVKDNVEKLVPYGNLQNYLKYEWVKGRSSIMKKQVKENLSKSDNCKDRLWVHKLENNKIKRLRIKNENLQEYLDSKWIIGYSHINIDEVIRLLYKRIQLKKICAELKYDFNKVKRELKVILNSEIYNKFMKEYRCFRLKINLDKYFAEYNNIEKVIKRE
jgi:hypothetical protein